MSTSSSKHRVIDVRKQRNLSLKQTLRLCVNGVAHRMVRSALTLAVVTLAVAFFMYLQTDNLIMQSVARRAQAALVFDRTAVRVLNNIEQKKTPGEHAAILAAAHNAADRSSLEVAARVSGQELAELEHLASLAAQEAAYLEFFDKLPTGKKMILVGKSKGRAVLRELSAEATFIDFEEELKPMHDVRVPGDTEALKTFLSDYASYETALSTFANAWNTQIEDLAQKRSALSGEARSSDWLLKANDQERRAWLAQVRESGFSLSDAQWTVILGQLESNAKTRNLVAELSKPEVMSAWKKTYRERKASSADEKISRVNEKKAMNLLSESFTEEELKDIRTRYLKTRRLEGFMSKLAGRVDVDQYGEGKLGGRQFFLLLISLVVCMVGITNAMLMSITERFREIATMKCLGATDRYILTQFMLEAGLQGALGGALGVLIGFLMGLIKNLLQFGSFALGGFPIGPILLGGLVSFLCGVILAKIASVYPSWSASRMAPMEAMRVE